jgi:hypothetical protein
MSVMLACCHQSFVSYSSEARKFKIKVLVGFLMKLSSWFVDPLFSHGLSTADCGVGEERVREKQKEICCFKDINLVMSSPSFSGPNLNPN